LKSRSGPYQKASFADMDFAFQENLDCGQILRGVNRPAMGAAYFQLIQFAQRALPLIKNLDLSGDLGLR